MFGKKKKKKNEGDREIGETRAKLIAEFGEEAFNADPIECIRLSAEKETQAELSRQLTPCPSCKSGQLLVSEDGSLEGYFGRTTSVYVKVIICRSCGETRLWAPEPMKSAGPSFTEVDLDGPASPYR